MASKQNFSVVIDLGTSKLTALAGKLTEAGKMEIMALAKAPSKGFKRGVVFNIEEAAASITDLLDILDSQLEEEIEIVDVALAGAKMQTIDYRCITHTSGEGFVTSRDVDSLMQEAQNVSIQQDYEVVKVIPVAYVIDDENEVEKPIGSTGEKIEAHFKLLVIPDSYLNNLRLVLSRIGLGLGDIIHASLAISEAVLTSEEKEMGVVVADFGAGTTNVAVYQDNVLKHTAVIPFGGQVVTSDIKEGCSIFLKKAELLKVKYGQAMGDFADDRKVVTIAGQNGWEARDVSFKSLAYIIQARLEEIIECVNDQILKAGIEDALGAGIVIAGGTSQLKDMVSLVKFKTAMDARRANAVIYPANRKEETRDFDFLTVLGAMKLVLSSGVVQPVGQTHSRSIKKKERRFAPRIKNVVQGALNLFDMDDSDLEFK